MRDIICLHIGQAGVQLGSTLWELLCLEHNINEQGDYFSDRTTDAEDIGTFFTVTAKNKATPRCIFADLDPTVVDEVERGAYRSLFHPDRLIKGPEDASNNFARGFFTIGKLLLEKINRELRRMFEACHNLQAFMIYRSLGGGTGSGLTSAMFDLLTDYPKTPKLEMPIYPSPTISGNTVEPYNALLAEHFCIEEIDVGLLFDNESLYDMCYSFLNIEKPRFNHINKLICQVCSSITASTRFPNVLNNDLNVLTTNLVPYPRIHFPLCNFAPVACESKAQSEMLSVTNLTHAVFDRDNQMLKIDATYGKYMSCALFYRGNVSPKEVYSALLDVKQVKTIDFVDWCPTGFKVGITTMPPVASPESFLAESTRNVTMLTNSSAIGQAWQRLCHKFLVLFSKKSFLHWFVGEGMDENEFIEALENVSTLVQDYEEVVIDINKPVESKEASDQINANQYRSQSSVNSF